MKENKMRSAAAQKIIEWALNSKNPWDSMINAMSSDRLEDGVKSELRQTFKEWKRTSVRPFKFADEIGSVVAG